MRRRRRSRAGHVANERCALGLVAVGFARDSGHHVRGDGVGRSSAAVVVVLAAVRRTFDAAAECGSAGDGRAGGGANTAVLVVGMVVLALLVGKVKVLTDVVTIAALLVARRWWHVAQVDGRRTRSAEWQRRR